MKRLILLSFVELLIGLFVLCKAENQVFLKIMNEDTNPMREIKIKIKVGSKLFTATLLDNPTSRAFAAQLPLTIKMFELNNNEKYTDLLKSLPINPSIPASIHSGDLMMFGSRTLVLFYESFNTSFRYTKIGKIDDATGLAAAVGRVDVTVSFALEKD
jgi:hypothetical protein